MKGKLKMEDFIKKVLLVKFRKAGINDAKDWAEILHNSYKLTYSEYISKEYMDKNYSKEKLKEKFLCEVTEENSKSEFYMLIHNDIIVGILKIGKPVKYYSDGNNYYKDNLDGIGEIKSLHVKKDYQGYGIGSQAISFAENKLKELNYNQASIWVKVQNINAINFYKNRGYQKTKFINTNTNDKAHSMVMEKVLRVQSKENKTNDIDIIRDNFI
jgi:ribosomal protein S18 acetylase RimI-like enzyme